MTTERRVLRLDEKSIVVVRRVPFTGATSDKLRIIRKRLEEAYYQEHGVDAEMPWPVVINHIIEEFYNRGGSK